MQTVPRNVQVATQDQATQVADLPRELRLALDDIVGVAREGLLAMSVATGMAVMQAMFEAEVTAVAGAKGKHDPERTAVRHGAGKGSVTLGGRRVPVTRPRARTLDGHEVPLESYCQFAADDLLGKVVLERMLAGVATRRRFCLRISRGVTGASPVAACMVAWPGAPQRTVPVADRQLTRAAAPCIGDSQETATCFLSAGAPVR